MFCGQVLNTTAHIEIRKEFVSYDVTSGFVVKRWMSSDIFVNIGGWISLPCERRDRSVSYGCIVSRRGVYQVAT